MKRLAGLGVFAAAFVASPLMAQSAPPLTDVQIVKVTSTNAPAETLSASATTTVGDHGGTVTYVVNEVGYAKTTRTMKLNGAIISNKAISDVPLCVSSTNPNPCSAGQTVIGFQRTYQVTTNGGTLEATSYNNRTPFNAITDTLIIK